MARVFQIAALLAAVFLVAPVAADSPPELKYAEALAGSAKRLSATLFGQSNDTGSSSSAQFAGVLELAGYGSQGGRRLLNKRKKNWNSDTEYSQLDFDFRIAATVIQDIGTGGNVIGTAATINPVFTFKSRQVASIGAFLSGDVVFPTNAVQEIEQGFLTKSPDEFLDGLTDFVQDGAWAAGTAALPYTISAKDVSFKTTGGNGSPLQLTSYSVNNFQRSLLSIGAVASIGGPVTGSKSLSKTSVSFPAQGDDIFGFDSDQCFVAYVQTRQGVVSSFLEGAFFALGLGADPLTAFAVGGGNLLSDLSCLVVYKGRLSYAKSSPYFKNYFAATEAINTGNLGEFAGKKNTLQCTGLTPIVGIETCFANVPALSQSKSKGKGKLL